MTTVEKIHLATIDDYLGDAEGRYFGNGYRLVDSPLGDIVLDENADGTDHRVRTTAGVLISRPWSTKALGNVRPHLSTIDAIVLAGQLVCAYVRRVWRLEHNWAAAMWLRHMDIRAGVKPLEDGLDSFEVSLTMQETVTDPSSRFGQVSTFVCEIGPMVVRCVLEHASGPTTAPDPRPADQSLGSVVDHRARRLVLADVLVDPRDQRGTATVIVLPEAVDATGVPTSYAPWTPMVEAFVAGLQLTQVLLYELDGVRRADSNTLWMRRTVLDSTTPLRYDQEPFAVATSLAGNMLVRANGGVWRTSTARSDCHGVRIRCDVTHQIPDGRTAGTTQRTAEKSRS